MTRLRLGACLSLSGRYARFGRQAAEALRAWQSLVGEAIELRVEDDGSDPDRVAGALARMARECDLLLGPYSTQLMREAGRAVADVEALLWNHGGSGDDVQAQCPGRIVSVLSPTSRYAEPFVRARVEEDERAPLWVVRGQGRFARQVAAGAMRFAERCGLEAVEKRADSDGVWLQEAPEVWDLFSVGTFEDDVAIVKQAGSAGRSPRAQCSIAGGVRDFASMVDRPGGIYGIAQWFPGRDVRPELGPSEHEFVSAYGRAAGSSPDYPGVQAAATAAIAMHCAKLAGSTAHDTLWATATDLETTTLYGAFDVDSRTGVQVGHAPVLLRWDGGDRQLVA